jgi:hypothetical protein
MKRFFLVVATCAIFSCASANEAAPAEQLEQWMTYYYLSPKPSQVPQALKAVADEGLFENEDALAPLSGFFSEVFRANPTKLEEWVKPYAGVPKRYILYSALWMANTRQSKSALAYLANAASAEESKELKEFLASQPPTIESMSIDSPASLDYLWGCFMGSGSEVPVLRIIDQLKLVNAQGDIGATLIGGAAQWSVSANARQHEKVLKIVRARVHTADPETKAILQKILSGIEAEKSGK